MTRRILLTAALTLAMVLPTAASADAPEMVGFFGYLTDLSGNAVEASDLKVEVSLYHDASGGTEFWSDTYTDVPAEKGTFFVLLGGGNNPLPTLELDGTVKYVGIKVNDSDELEPRLQLVSVPYAMRAGAAGVAIFAEDAGKLGGLSVEDFAKATDVIDPQPLVAALQSQIDVLQAKVEQLEELVKNPGCTDECSPDSVGCSDDGAQLFTCGEADDGDPCAEKIFEACVGSLQCVAGECTCAPNFAKVCVGDAAFEQDSCGKAGKQIAACGEGLCSEGACVNWHRETPLQLPGINGLLTLGGSLFAVGDGGVVVHYDGLEWTHMATPTSLALNAVWGHQDTGDIELFAVGANGKVLHYDGTSWGGVYTGFYSTLRGIDGLNGNAIIAVGDGGTVLQFKGAGWQKEAFKTDDPWLNTNFRDVWAANASKIWVVGDNGHVVFYDGSDWTLQDTTGTETFRAIAGLNDSAVFGARDGKISFFQTAWNDEPLSPATAISFRALTADLDELTGPKVFAVGDNANVYKWGGIGLGFAKQEKPQQILGDSASLVGVDGGDDAPHAGIWIAANDGRTAYLNAEDKWVFPAVTETVRGFYGLPGSSANQWAVGTDCLALRFQEGQWLPVDIDGGTCDNASGTQDFRAIWGTDTTNIIAVGESGLFKQWDGTAWIEVETNPGPPGTQTNNDIWGMDPSNYLVVRDDAAWVWNGTIWQSTGGGAGVSGFGTSMQDFFVVDGSTGSVKHFDGSEWSSETISTSNLRDIWGNSGQLWAVGDNGAAYWHDGSAWHDRSIPEDVVQNGSLTSVWFTNLTQTHVSANGGYSYQYDDATDEWKSERTFPTNAHHTVFGITGSNVLLGGVQTIYRRK